MTTQIDNLVRQAVYMFTSGFVRFLAYEIRTFNANVNNFSETPINLSLFG